MEHTDLTVGDLRRALEGYDKDDEVTFEGGLTFYRIKKRGTHHVVIEFNEPQACLTDAFKKKNPRVKVVYLDASAIQWNKEGTLSAPMDTTVR